MIEMNPYAIMRMTIDTLKPSSPDLGTCFISTLGESKIDTLTLTINMENHHLPPRARGDGKDFADIPRGTSGPLLILVQILMSPVFFFFCVCFKSNLPHKFLCGVCSQAPSFSSLSLCSLPILDQLAQGGEPVLMCPQCRVTSARRGGPALRSPPRCRVLMGARRKDCAGLNETKAKGFFWFI